MRTSRVLSDEQNIRFLVLQKVFEVKKEESERESKFLETRSALNAMLNETYFISVGRTRANESITKDRIYSRYLLPHNKKEEERKTGKRKLKTLC